MEDKTTNTPQAPIPGASSQPATDLLSHLIAPGDLVFDIGANAGGKTAQFLTHRTRVVCVEPQPGCVSRLRERFSDNARVTVVPAGVAHQTGTLPLSVCDQKDYLSTFSDDWKSGRFSGESWNRKVDVEVTTLDGLIAQHGLPRFCKIDVEGFELPVLQGLSQPIEFLSLEFAAEFLDRTRACLVRLNQLGYRLFNYAAGESRQFALDRWVSAHELITLLGQNNDPLFWGDVYARFSPAPFTPDNTTPALPCGALWEPAEVPHGSEPLLHRLASSPLAAEIQCLYEIGAHRFEERSAFDHLFPALSRLVLFEPNPTLFKDLEETTAAGKHLTLLPYAVSNVDGTAELNLADNDGHSSSLLPMGRHSEVFPNVAYQSTVSVATRRLATAIGTHHLPQPDLLFIDAQGAEHKILADLTPELRRGIKVIYTETSLEELYQGSLTLDELRVVLEPEFRFLGYAPQSPETPTHGNALFVRDDCCHLLRAAVAPRVSVLVSTYNSERYLAACLEDLLAQTIADQIEIIVIDSGSEQNERAIAETYQARHPGIRYLRTKRESLYAAWNRGVRVARGQYITNANADDAHRPDALELLANALDKHPEAELAYGDYFNSSQPNDSFACPHPTRKVQQPPYHPAILMFYCVTGCHPMWRRTVFDRIGLFDPSFTAPGDYELLLRFAAAGLRAVHVPECISLFYQNPEGLSLQSVEKSRHEWALIQARYRAEMPIECLFRVSANDPASLAAGWTALGNLAMNHQVPWFDNPSQDLDYAEACYQKALSFRPEDVTALNNLALAKLLKGRTDEVQELMVRVPPHALEKLAHGIECGRLELIPIEMEPPAPSLTWPPAEAAAVASRPTAASQPVTHPVHEPAAMRGQNFASGEATVRAGATVIAMGHGEAAEAPSARRELERPVRWIAPFHSPGPHAEDILRILPALSHHIELVTLDRTDTYSMEHSEGLSAEARSTLQATREHCNFVVGGISITSQAARDFVCLRGTTFHIARTTIEVDRLPLSMVKTCNQMDEIWVPGEFTRECFARSGVEARKLVVVPTSVDVDRFSPDTPPAVISDRARFNFLFTSDWSERSGWELLLDAFWKEFSATDDVRLIIRSGLPGLTRASSAKTILEVVEQHAQRIGRSNNSKVIVCTEEDLAGVYRAADCLVSPAHGDGWGMQILEAMGCGLPVIATRWGAHLDFATEANAWLIDHDLVENRATERDLLHLRGQRWAAPSLTHFRKLLREAASSPEVAREKGLRARETVTGSYSTQSVAELIANHLAAVDQRLNKPSCPPAVAMVSSPTLEPPSNNRSTLSAAWEGTFLDVGSLSHVNREITTQISKQQRIQLTCVNTGTQPKKQKQSLWKPALGKLKTSAPSGTQVTIRHAWPPKWDPPPKGKWVLVQPWEYGFLPKDWVKHLDRVDEVWVPSEYVRRVCVDSGVDPFKVKIVPNGIDPERFRPGLQSMPLPTQKQFKFLFVGGTIARKGPDVLLDAYLRAFTKDDDVCLVVKDFGSTNVYAGQSALDEIRTAQQRPNAPEILLITDELDAAQMPALYNACDCLVHPYRGEGFGLPVLEAMACGLPVIVTGGGGTDDFATDDFAYRLPALRKQMATSIGGMPLTKPGWWLEPDAESLVQSMRHVVTHPDEAKARGQAASEHARSQWAWQRAGQIASDRLHALSSEQATETVAIPTTAKPECTPKDPPPVASVGSLEPARKALAQKDPETAWSLCIEAIERRPFHPEAYLFLAEVAAVSGDPDRSSRFAKQALAMTPGWGAAQDFKPAVASSQPGKTCNGPGLDSLPDPDAAPRLSVCLIAKNEGRVLARCLASVQAIAHQIIVVDTGSTDQTASIAREFGAEVRQARWEDDFSAARNLALEHATGDWILVLDADEELAPGAAEQLEQEMQTPSVIAYRLPIVDAGREENGCNYVPRLFRNAPGVWFLGRIHENPFESIQSLCQRWKLSLGLGRAKLRHHGYTDQAIRDGQKTARNLRLLELALQESPADPNLHLNLGLELMKSGQRDESLQCYRKAFQLLSARPARHVAPELRETLLTQFATHLVAARKYADVVRLLESPLARQADLTSSMHFLEGLALNELRRFSKAERHLRRSVETRHQATLTPALEEVRKAGPFHALAVCLSKNGNHTEADSAFRTGLTEDTKSRPLRFDYAAFLARTGRQVNALEVLHQLVTDNATDTDAWQLGGQIALSKPEFIEFADDWTREALKYCPGHPGIVAQRRKVLSHTASPGNSVLSR